MGQEGFGYPLQPLLGAGLPTHQTRTVDMHVDQSWRNVAAAGVDLDGTAGRLAALAGVADTTACKGNCSPEDRSIRQNHSTILDEYGAHVGGTMVCEGR
jgi:hypothetical protein